MASIRDIAKLAGVSPATVSRILNRDKTFSINNHTRQRVLDYADQLNYSKGINKHSPKKKADKHSIALVVRHSESGELNDPYFRYIRRGIEKEAEQWRMKVYFAFRMRDEHKDLEVLSKYGAVLIIGNLTQDALNHLSKYNNNLVIIDDYYPYDTFDSVQTDFEIKTNTILDILWQNGHRNIAFVGGIGNRISLDGNTTLTKDEIRASTYKKWMESHNLTNFICIKQDDWSPESGYDLTRKILKETSKLPTAIVVACDPMAIGVYKAIHDSKLKIPQNISISSFDDLETSQFLSPPLTSVEMNAEEMGKIAVRLAKERIFGERKIPIKIVCASQLKIRDSLSKIKY